MFNEKSKKALALLAATATALTIFPTSALAATENESNKRVPENTVTQVTPSANSNINQNVPLSDEIYEGTWGNLSWKFESYDGLLTISGEGLMADFEDNSTEAWRTYAANVKSVVLESNVTSIGANAFANCNNLASVIIKGDVESIGNNAFNKCKALSNIELPDSLNSIGEYAFALSGLTRITIPAAVTEIADYTFQGCSALFYVTLPEGLVSIGNHAFHVCVALKNITIPNSVKTIGDYCFYNCTAMTSISISNAAESIGNRAFYNCTELESIVIPDSVKNIGNYAFLQCSKLSAVTIGNGVETIENNTFHACSALTDVTIGNNVKSIGDQAFYGCFALKTIEIPSSVTTIGKEVFMSCNELTTINNASGVVTIGDFAFRFCRKLQNVFIADSVTSIGENAFDGCKELNAITVGENNQTFSGVEGVLVNETTKTLIKYPVKKSGTAYSIPEGIEAIAEKAFEDCHTLKELNIPASLTTIGDYAFKGLKYLEKITVSADNTAFCEVDGVLLTKDKTFIVLYPACKTTEHYVIPDSVVTIGGYAFNHCSSLKAITVGQNLKNILDNAFDDVAAMKDTYYIETNPSSINAGVNNSAFYGEKKHYNISGTWGDLNWHLDFDNKLTISGNGAMDDFPTESDYIHDPKKAWRPYADYIKTVVIEEGVTSIGKYAFYECIYLRDIYIEKDITLINEYAFRRCNDSINIHYNGSSRNWQSITVADGNEKLASAIKFFAVKAPKNGDVNDDGYVDNTDAAIILKHDAGIITLDTDLTDVADVNGDGVVDNSDAAKVLKYDAGIIDRI